MEIFDFPYHTVEVENPESSFRVQMGGSYVFVAPPTDPDQRIITLYFPTMKYFFNEFNILDETVNPEYNMLRLINFYKVHKMHEMFEYVHPVHGVMTVRFNQPLKEPRGIPGGNGAVEAFSIQLIEVP